MFERNFKYFIKCSNVRTFYELFFETLLEPLRDLRDMSITIQLILAQVRRALSCLDAIERCTITLLVVDRRIMPDCHG